MSAATSAAQQPDPPAAIRALAATGLRSVLVDEPGDGNVWVLAPGYKARFGTDGVEFIPYYGGRRRATSRCRSGCAGSSAAGGRWRWAQTPGPGGLRR